PEALFQFQRELKASLGVYTITTMNQYFTIYHSSFGTSYPSDDTFEKQKCLHKKAEAALVCSALMRLCSKLEQLQIRGQEGYGHTASSFAGTAFGFCAGTGQEERWFTIILVYGG